MDEQAGPPRALQVAAVAIGAVLRLAGCGDSNSAEPFLVLAL